MIKQKEKLCIYLTEFTPYEVERRFGAGMENDKGDLVGIPDTVIQIANWKDTNAACITGSLEKQNNNA